ncbi:MAG: hypothetical protein NDJ89_11715 [Oligoflexia bacterium]|nr:hypothetical protein [Oligoflexia bacterium]
MFAAILSLALAFSAFWLFLSLCWTAAADAQGAIAFIFYAPVLAILLTAAFLIGRRTARFVSLVLVLFIAFFYAAPLIGWSAFSDGVIGLVADSFEAVTGKSPMQWDKKL